MSKVLVIGAGVGGLCAAILLASRGFSVEVIEASGQAGGKAGIQTVDGVEVDTGPSVLTLPDAFAGVFAAAGSRMEDHLSLRRLSPAFDYRFPDGARLLIHESLPETLAAIRESLGATAEAEFAAFLKHAGEIWAVSERRFVHRPVPELRALLSWEALQELWRIAPFQKMQAMIHQQVKSPPLRRILERYATYNGSDVRRAPAALNCIAHVELALGGFGVEGGIYALIRALVRLAETRGVQFRFDTSVNGIRIQNGCITEVSHTGGVTACDTVVANADVSRVLGEWLPQRRRVPEPSMSGWTAIFRARRGDPGRKSPRVAHTVLFPEDYQAEFADLFDRRRSPEVPTVYLCAQEACHGRVGWAEEEPVFVMANAPPGSDEDEVLKQRVYQRLIDASLILSTDTMVWSRGPRALAQQFGGGGAIYGGSSNSPMAAFLRPANRVPGIRGLYLASGSAHPGGGLPLCAWSGRLAAQAVLEDQGSSP